ncbi:APC family permease [Qipengyuania sp. YG27]|uniref:APC family permease n=1 Tax=Qipengyuania mesophila TaxID=2867246 RepID=A0ABS7JQQ2_9SPHN|nr:APC family permease [Qipengyuania mesophila]MBX7499962.1 APC family permease [Qipengyuania mesophila]
MSGTDRGEAQLGPGGAWAMAVGGMIGGGIFSTLGVVISVAGKWAWVSFLVGGLVALASGHSYSALTRQIDRPGGSYAYLRELGWNRLARVVVWLLVVGYVFTVAVYAVTFGSYAAFALGAPGWAKTLAAIAAIMVLAGINLMGAAEATLLEKVAVWGKLAILLGLAGFGLAHWDTAQLVADPGKPVGLAGALVGMGVVFMAYEGFQLLSYDYDEMVHPSRTIAIAMPAAILVTMATYILVALGAAMLAGAPEIVRREEVALAIAGREALGQTGFLAVSLAAVFSAGSAINATVFATARLALGAARDGEMPALFARLDGSGVPWFGTLVISGAAIVLTVVGGLEVLVEGGSFVFLSIFALVNGIAWHRRAGRRWIAAVGLAGSLVGVVMLVLYLAGIV